MLMLLPRSRRSYRIAAATDELSLFTECHPQIEVTMRAQIFCFPLSVSSWKTFVAELYALCVGLGPDVSECVGLEGDGSFQGESFHVGLPK